MPVYLVFLQVAKKNLQLALRGPNLPASLEACKLRQWTGHRVLFHIVKIECPLICSNPLFVIIFNEWKSRKLTTRTF